jgi:hypothetical protein
VGVGEHEAGGREMDRSPTLEGEGEEKPTADSHCTVEGATTTTKHGLPGGRQVEVEVPDRT